MAQPTGTSNRRRAVQVAAPVFAGLLLLGACGKKDEPAASSSSGQSSSGSVTTKAGGSTSDTSKSTGTTTGTATKGSTVGNTALNQTVWYEGFKITLGDVTYDTTDQAMEVAIEVENLGNSTATFYGDNVTLEDGNTQVATGHTKDNPSILAKGKAKTKLDFDVDAKVDTSKLILVMGAGNQQQVRVPLNGSSTGVTTLKPVPQSSIQGDLPVGQVTLTPTAAEVRYDDIDNHSQMDKGKVNFVIVGKAKNNSDQSTMYLEKGKVSIALPDGSKQNADVFSSKDSLEATKTVEFTLGFILPDPFAGDYTLTFTEDWGPNGDATNVTQPLTLVSASSTTSGTTPGSTPGTTKK